jgi:hypothetical protein
MHRKMTRVVVPLTTAVMAATTAATTAGTCAWSQDDPSAPARKAVPAETRCRSVPSSPSAPAEPRTRSARSAAPAQEPAGDVLDLASPLRVAEPVQVTLTARPRGSGSDLVRYRIEARSPEGPQHGVTVTARLTCLPGDAWVAGRPTRTTGQLTAQRRALVWRLDLEKTSEIATFTVRVRPGDRGGELTGELTTRGPRSNCPAGEAGAPADPSCRATVRVPPRPAPAAQPVTPTPSGRPITPTPLTRPVAPAPAVQSITPAPLARPRVGKASKVSKAGKAPVARPKTRAAGAPAAGAPAVPAPGLPAPVIPAPAVPALPAPAPGKSGPLSQVDRAPLVPLDSMDSDAARAAAPEVVPPEMVARSADYPHEDLSGRSFGFLVGAVALLLVAVAVAGRTARVAVRRRHLRAVAGKRG